MAKSIWKILGIKKTNDIAEIKKAYATKLKVTRPDQDPEGFQILRQARESAERMAKSKLIATNEEIKDRQISSVELDLEISFQESIEESITTVRNLETLDESKENSESQPEEVLTSWIKGEIPEPDWQIFSEALRDLQILGLGSREVAEFNLLRAIQENFEWRLAPLTQDEGGELTPPMTDTVDKTILLLCEEFGWFENDRRISDLLYWGGEQLTDQLRNLKEYGRISGGWSADQSAKPAWKLPGLWVWIIVVVALHALRYCSTKDDHGRYVPPVPSIEESKPLISL